MGFRWREQSMSLVQGRRKGSSSRRHFTHHMALVAPVTLCVRAHCTRGCSLHLGRRRNIRRTLHTISLEFLFGGGDRTTGSRSRLDKRRPHVPPRPRLVPISRDEARCCRSVCLAAPALLAPPPPPPVACTCASRRPRCTRINITHYYKKLTRLRAGALHLAARILIYLSIDRTNRYFPSSM